jgi:hypothetical protein
MLPALLSSIPTLPMEREMHMFAKRSLLIVCPMLVAAVVALAIAGDAPQAQQAEISKQLEALLRERQETLGKIVEILDARYRRGIGGEDTAVNLTHAKAQLYDAQLDLAKTKDERIAIREKIVANLREVERRAEARVQGGGADALLQKSLLEAKAARLKAEIQLLREKTA